VPPQVTPQVESLLRTAEAGPATRADLQTAAGIRDRKHFRLAYLEPLIQAAWLELTIPAKPQSRLQRYRITTAGREALERSRK